MAAPTILLFLGSGLIIFSTTSLTDNHYSSPGFGLVLPLRCEEPSFTKRFQSYAFKYNKSYMNDSTEFYIRCNIFKANMEKVDQLNKLHNENTGAIYGETKFSDLTPEEFEAKHLSSYMPLKHHLKMFGAGPSDITRMTKFSLKDVPQRVDWRDQKAVTPIKDQKSCGACWAFSIVECMESMYSIQYSATVPRLSVQQVIDCDNSNQGCSKGDICSAANWAKNNGIVPESKYPLTDKTETCKNVSTAEPRFLVDSSRCAGYIKKEEEMLRLIATRGPIAVVVGAATWHNYVGGIIQFHCAPIINHAVVIVGYDLSGVANEVVSLNVKTSTR